MCTRRHMILSQLRHRVAFSVHLRVMSTPLHKHALYCIRVQRSFRATCTNKCQFVRFAIAHHQHRRGSHRNIKYCHMGVMQCWHPSIGCTSNLWISIHCTCNKDKQYGCPESMKVSHTKYEMECKLIRCNQCALHMVNHTPIHALAA